MMLNDLETAVRQSLETGRLGTPVSLRMHWQLPQPETDLAAWLALLARKFVSLLGDPPARLMAQRCAEGRQWHLLLTGTRGRTASLALGCGASKTPQAQLLVIGNHGLLRLTGSEPLEREPTALLPETEAWRAAVDESCRQQATVELKGFAISAAAR